MASIHKTPAGTYEVRYREGDRNRSRTFKARDEAVAWQGTVERSDVAPVRDQDAPTLDAYTQAWIGSRPELAPSTLKLYASLLDTHILPDLGTLKVTKLHTKRLRDWQRDRLAADAGPAVLGKAQTVLKQILDEAVLDGYLPANPLASLRKPGYRKREHRWLNAVEVEKIRAWFLEHDDVGSAALVSVLAYIGIRPQDALALEWRDLDERLSVVKKNADGQIIPGSKTGDGYKRRVLVPAPVRADLMAWRLEIPDAELIFPRRDGQPWTKTDFANWRSRRQSKNGKQTVGKCFKKAALEVGIGWEIRPYDLRHTAASIMASCGYSHIEIANQLGHSPNMSMRTYQHLLEIELGRERRPMDEYITEARREVRSGFVRDLGKERQLVRS